MRPPCQHSNFFSSLKQVEKRLKSEHHTQHSNNDYKESLGSPIYLIHTDQTYNNSTFQDTNSEPPQAFLSPPSSSSSQLNNSHDHQACTTALDQVSDTVDEIQRLIQLLGLSGLGKNCDSESKDCDVEFYEKVVGVKGPKGKKEVERMNGWIEYYMNCEEDKSEPLRLAHLLLAKAACVFEGENDGLEFPATVDEFLKNDPPHEEAVDEANGHLTCGFGNIAYCKANATFGTCDVPRVSPPPPAALPPPRPPAAAAGTSSGFLDSSPARAQGLFVTILMTTILVGL